MRIKNVRNCIGYLHVALLSLSLFAGFITKAAWVFLKPMVIRARSASSPPQSRHTQLSRDSCSSLSKVSMRNSCLKLLAKPSRRERPWIASARSLSKGRCARGVATPEARHPFARSPRKRDRYDVALLACMRRSHARVSSRRSPAPMRCLNPALMRPAVVERALEGQ